MKNPSGAYHSNPNSKRKHPKRCTLVVYHISTVLLLIGIIVTIIGLATTRLFHVYIYDHRNPAKFHHVHIPVGLFSISTHVTWLSMQKSTLPNDLEINDSRWTLAGTMSLVGLLTAIAAFIVHLTLAYCKANHKWVNVLVEVVLLLVAVMCVLVGLSLAETEIEYIHDHGDADLTKMLLSNGLLGTKAPMQFQLSSDGYTNTLGYQKTSQLGSDNQFSETDNTNGIGVVDKSINYGGSSGSRSTDSDFLGSNGEFALFLTPPLSSFFLLISADFIFLLSFLAVLIYFVRLCEKADEDRKQMRSAETSHA
ncbi:unnamed protein product [Heterobilharzia americana]|nr:unnamed protein product [Heterobilharzia americana]CAH8618075.1 unnamed protein product [Heterobilharzia americana]